MGHSSFIRSALGSFFFFNRVLPSVLPTLELWAVLLRGFRGWVDSSPFPDDNLWIPFNLRKSLVGVPSIPPVHRLLVASAWDYPAIGGICFLGEPALPDGSVE